MWSRGERENTELPKPDPVPSDIFELKNEGLRSRSCQKLTFVRQTKEKLGMRAMGREVIGANGSYELRDTEISYNGHYPLWFFQI